jgi:heptosyltransferase-2
MTMSDRAAPGPDRIRELLVRGPNWLGDLVMTTPALRALRVGLPEARITLLVRPGLEALLEGSPLVDRVRVQSSHHAGPGAVWREARALAREARFDTGLCIPDSISSALFMRLARVGRVVGHARGGRGLLLHEAVTAPAEWGQRRMVARERVALGLVEALGVREQGTGLELHVTPAGEQAARALLEHHRLDAGTAPLVGLAPGASFGASKCWPPDYYAAVGDRVARAGARVVLLGSPAEAALCREVADRMQAPAPALAGALGLDGLVALVRRLSLLLCNDAGARHVAAAFAVPSIVFFGPTAVEKTNLNLEHVQVLQTNADCRPCYRRECPIDHRCLRDIPPEPVAKMALEVLEGSAAAPALAEGA